LITVTKPWEPVLVIVKSLKDPCADSADVMAENEVIVGLLEAKLLSVEVDQGEGFRPDTFLADEPSLEFDDVANTDQKLVAELNKAELDIEIDCEIPVPDTIFDSVNDVFEMFELVIMVGIDTWLGDSIKVDLIDVLGEIPGVDELYQIALCVDVERNAELFLYVDIVWNEDEADWKLTLVPVASLLTPLCRMFSSAPYCFKLDTLDLSPSSHVVDLRTITVFGGFPTRLMLRPIGDILPSELIRSPIVRRCAPRPK
jgi:hypothetical protein